MDMMHEMMTHFHFLRPWVAWFVPLVLLLLYAFKRGQAMDGAWGKYCSAELLAYLRVQGGDGKQGRSSWLWSLLVAALLLTAWAGPTWKKWPQPLYQHDSALVIVLDLSLSMNAQDIKPSRLMRAKQKITDLLRLRHEGQTALVVFAGTAHVVTPLTDDVRTIESQLQALSPAIMPEQGGHIDAAIAQALQLFRQSSVQHGVVLLLTDSDNSTPSMVQALAQEGHKLDVIAVGTVTGAPIPQATGGFVKDAQGHVVIPKVSMARLQALAESGQGEFHLLTTDDADLQGVLQQLKPAAWQSQQMKRQTQVYDVWYEEGPWLILLAIPLLLMGFRRGVLMVILVAGVQAQPAQAWDGEHVWQSAQHQGERLMQQKKYSEAARQLEQPAWRAVAYYKAGDYQAAVKAFQAISQPTADDIYNYGNALAHLGQLDAAIAAYDQALKMNPKLTDAKHNKAVLEKLKKKASSKQQGGGKKSQPSQQNHDGKPGKQQNNQADKQPGQASKGQNKQQGQQEKSAQLEQAAQGQHEQEARDKKQQAKRPPSPKSSKAGKKGNKDTPSHQRALSPEEMKKLESKQAFEQAMRRVPDDPGGLLRRKFLYQYQQQHGQTQQGGVAW